MLTLTQVALHARRTIRDSWAYGAAAVAVVLVGVGFFDPATHPRFWIVQASVLVACACGILFLWAPGVERGQPSELRWSPSMGALLVAWAFGLVQLVGGPTGPFAPLSYVVTAALVAQLAMPAAALLAAEVLALEAVVCLILPEHPFVREFVAHAAFILAFASLSSILTRTEVHLARKRVQDQLAQQREQAASDSRLFRLVSGSTGSIATDEMRIFEASVDEIHQSVYHLLNLLKRTLRLHTCALLMPSPDGQSLQIAELSSDSDEITRSPIPIGSGAIGAAVQQGKTTRLDNVRLGYRGIGYYNGPSMVRALLAVPVIDRGQVGGVVCVDRLQAEPFTEDEEAIVRDATDHVLRALENERVFLQLERSKREQSMLYGASQRLGGAINPEDVMNAAARAVGEIAKNDLFVITEFDPELLKHTVRYVEGDSTEALVDLTFSDNTSLTAMVVKNHHYLPYRGEFDPAQQVLFTRRTRLDHIRSLLVMPLMSRDTAIGTLVVGCKRPQAFPDSVRATLHVLANQVAVAFSNARAVRRLEELATTDALTGCANKRTFLDEAERRLRAAERFGRHVTLVVVDLDHFKSVNDTHGHLAGDRVLQSTGRLLRQEARETDIVGRFGGEEFCMLCEETDLEGAVQFAERVRERIMEMQVSTEDGVLQVTASIGVATFPMHGRSADQLFEQADRALYVAKRNGRNQVRRP